MSLKIEIDRAKVNKFCRKWKITKLELFGSVLRDDFSDDSDVDVLVSFEPDSRVTLFQFVGMKSELSQIIEREVDLVSRRGLETSLNYLRRKSIFASAQVFYAA
ncbi:MAG: nucleotidyltransferase domain-containing protein [Calditrichaeota bacterium]|nr:nucleotidyltransferase domain-containing protein [Calditrichota bacterium]